MKILFENATVYTGEKVLKNAFLAINDTKITYVGEARPSGGFDRVISGRGKVILPGLVNAHTHLSMTLLRGVSDTTNLQSWLFDNIFPIEARMTPAMKKVGALLGMAEGIACGTTAFSDMYGGAVAISEAARDTGIKLNISRGTTEFSDRFDPAKNNDAIEYVELFRDWHGLDNGRIRVDSSIHAEYTSNHDTWEYMVRLAKDNHAMMHLHLSETEKEHREGIARRGKTPAQAFAEYGVFDVPVLAAHSVWAEPEDLELIKKSGGAVAHNPVSNLKLGSGIFDSASALRMGVTVALGTDGTASNNNLDLFEEMKSAVLLSHIRAGMENAISAEDALKMATRNGAAAQGRSDECGVIKEGFDADLAVVDFDKPHLSPCHDVISNLVYAARGSDVCMTMVRGRILYENGDYLTIDMERLNHDLAKVLDELFPGKNTRL